MTRRLRYGALFYLAQASLALPVWFAVSASAWAQQVVRCEGSDGQVVYANSACPSGTRAVRTIEPVKGPSESDRKAAQTRAQLDAKELERVEREQKKAEAQAERARTAAAAKANAKARECAKLERSLRDAKVDLERAPLNKRDPAERKVKRAQERLDADCG